MDQVYEILEVGIVGRRLTAVLPLAQVLGHELSQSLRADYDRLAESPCELVELDLRQVEHVDGTCFSRLLELRGSLERRSISLEIRVSENLMQIIRFTKLDRLLRVTMDSETLDGEPV